jgi:hypothetical protein
MQGSAPWKTEETIVGLPRLLVLSVFSRFGGRHLSPFPHFSFLGEWWRLYDDGKEAAMIELTDQQVQALENPEGTPLQLVNPRTKETFVLLRVDEYKRLTEDYDDSPWTREELEALAWESGKHIGWEDMDEYDDALEKP